MRRSFFIGLIVLLALAVGWWRVTSADKPFNNLEKKMAADKVGGETPEEILALFIKSLREKNFRLASGYFLLDKNGSRQQWEGALLKLDDDGFKKLADTLETAQAWPEEVIDSHDFKFAVRNGQGVVQSVVNMEFNNFSKLWKIESL